MRDPAPVIARATTGDAREIGAFQARCWEQTYRGVVPDAFLDGTAAVDRAARWEARIRTRARSVLVARSRDGTLLGVTSTARSTATVSDLPALELVTLYVDRPAHGTGVAARLLAAAIGDEDAHLLVFAANTRARRFYEKHGFAREGAKTIDPGTGLDEERWVRRRPV
ncbi:N-acetyltransferase family protein [Curtobacterium flaccumfaciens]|uniref:GNAT family N-acetyltransferase n=1 Tax=Curtobacterium flaccumfaciens TaxID=2035 RepID=UPI0039A178E2